MKWMAWQHRSLVFLLGLGTLLAAGCASSGPYQYGRREQYQLSKKLPTDEPQIEHGEHRPALDRVGWVVGIPSKIVLWNQRVDNHEVSVDTEAALARYLQANELGDVKVRVNQYAPREEWRRLVKNDSVGAGWRYTLGTLSVARYTVLPGRVFGGDNYNPYTNTISIYSDVPAVAIHEGGHAKDFAARRLKGTNAAVYAIVPGASLYYEARATRDALAYIREHEPYELEREALETLYPAYGTYVGDTIGGLAIAPVGLAWGAGVVGGHLLGRYRSHQVPEFDMRTVSWDEEGSVHTDQPPADALPEMVITTE